MTICDSDSLTGLITLAFTFAPITPIAQGPDVEDSME